MTTTDPYADLRADLSGQPPVATAVFPPGHPDAPPTLDPAPPGMVWTMLPNGARALAYLPPGYEQTTTPTSPAAPAVAGPAQPDVWPKRMMTAGGSVSMVLGAIALAGPHLTQAGHAAEMTGLGVGATCLGVGGLFALVKGSLGSKHAPVNVSVNVTNTSNSRSTSSSRSSHRNH